MQLSLFRHGPLTEALRPLLDALPDRPDAGAVLADLIDLRGGVALAEHLGDGLRVPDPALPETRVRLVAEIRARYADDMDHLERRLSEALADPFRPRYRLPDARRAWLALEHADALTTRKGAPLRSATRLVWAPFFEFLDTHLKRARYALRELREAIEPMMSRLGGEGAALARLDAAVRGATRDRTEALIRRVHQANERAFARVFGEVVRGLSAAPSEAELAPAFAVGGPVAISFFEALALVRAVVEYERRLLAALVDAVCAAASAGLNAPEE